MSERYGDYELLRHIATGGMAEIHLARQAGFGGLGRLLIIKRMLPQLAVRPDFVTMFLDEARLTASLQHPNIVRVHDLGENEGSYFIAMELVDGPHLGALFAHSLRARNPLPLDLCAWVVARAADGLHYAHEKHDDATGQPLHLVHRDISPQNILVSRTGEVKVTDFGVAKAATQRTKTRTGIIKGKVAYMSPEQCLGDQIDRRTDVFALGIVLYELLTRRRLYRDKSDLLIMQKITSEDVPPPSTVNPQIDPALDAIVLTAMARDLEARYQTAEALAESLDGWLAGRADDRALGEWFERNCHELAPSSFAPLPAPQQAEIPVDDKTSATPAMATTVRAETPAQVTAISSPPAVPTTVEPPSLEVSDAGPRAPAPAGPPLSSEIASPVTAVPRKLPIAAIGGGVVAIVAAVVVAAAALRDDPRSGPGLGVPVVDAGVRVMGTLRVETTPPGVPIIVGDKVVGRSPVIVEHQAGKVSVQAQFADQPPRSVDIDVPVGGEATAVVHAWVPLVVRSTPPKAKVRIDGELRGETPFQQGFLVQPGRPVKVRLEAAGFLPWEEQRIAEPGQPLEVDAKLQPAAGKRDREEFGKVSVRCEPWANVKLGDAHLGETPFAEVKARAGRQTMTITNPKEGLSDSFPVTVPKDKTLVVLLRYEKQGGAWKLTKKTIR